MDHSMHIAIGAAPLPDMTLAHEIRLLKPALLYGDRVTLISPKIALLSGVLELGSLTRDQLIRFVVDLAPLINPGEAHVTAAGFAEYRRVRRKKRGKSRAEIILIQQFERNMESLLTNEWRPLLETMSSDSGADQLRPAIESGLLEISPLLSSDNVSMASSMFPGRSKDATDGVIDAFVGRLANVISAPSTYPLFDDETGNLVRKSIEEGLMAISPGSRDRGTQVSAAAGFMDRLPAFEKATIPEILQIRDELRTPLVRFRSAIVKISRTIEAAPFEAAFADEVEAVYREEIAPSLLEIEEQVRDNAYLRGLVGELIPQLGRIAGGLLTVGITRASEIPAFIANVPSEPMTQIVTGAGAAAAVGPIAVAAVRQAWEKQERSRAIQRSELYFLYRTGQLLG